MGDHFERIVDVEVTGEEAGALAERMVGWMVSEGLITREMSGDGVYSTGVDQGYLPGAGWSRAVTDSPEPGWLPGPVAVLIGRERHAGGQGEDDVEYAVCPRCRNRTVFMDYPDDWPDEREADEEIWRPFEDALTAWKETGAGSVTCVSCGASVPVTDWRWEPNFAVGALAFDFWGWPPLSASFCVTFGEELGHRTVEQLGKF